MKYSAEQLYEEFAPLVESLDLVLVDCVYGGTKFGVHLGLVIYSQNGVGTDECAQVYRLALPRLEVLLDSRDVHLEVTSPGLDRKIKHPREYRIFEGKRVKVLTADQDWIHGIIASSDSSSVRIEMEKDVCTVQLSDILKAQLEYTWEDK